jgi:hypothetical protein
MDIVLDLVYGSFSGVEGPAVAGSDCIRMKVRDKDISTWHANARELHIRSKSIRYMPKY